jgi:glucose-6-phosphate 1-dehydrogenase
MEQPPVLQSDAIHASKQSVMQDMEAVTLRYAVRGQYKTYTSEVGNEKSLVETFAAFRINIKNERWDGVPMIIKTGKSLARKLSEVNVVFKPTAHSPHHNILSFRISPKEGIELSLRVKQPGFDDKIQPVEMDFDYKTSFSTVDFSPTAYERVLVDAVRGDHTLFATAEEILESWRVVMPAVSAWAESNKDLVQYDNGSTGTDISLLYPDVV